MQSILESSGHSYERNYTIWLAYSSSLGLFGRSRELMLYKEVGVTLDYSNRKEGENKVFSP